MHKIMFAQIFLNYWTRMKIKYLKHSPVPGQLDEIKLHDVSRRFVPLHTVTMKWSYLNPSNCFRKIVEKGNINVQCDIGKFSQIWVYKSLYQSIYGWFLYDCFNDINIVEKIWKNIKKPSNMLEQNVTQFFYPVQMKSRLSPNSFMR